MQFPSSWAKESHLLSPPHTASHPTSRRKHNSNLRRAEAGRDGSEGRKAGLKSGP
jgi:hypothetical protein